MRKSITLLLAVALTAVSCRNHDSDVIREVRVKGKILTEIVIDNIPTEVVRMNLSDLYEEFRIIPLETNDNCLIGQWNRRIKITENELFIGYHGGGDPAILLRFDPEGNFINRIGAGGRGPGEHLGPDVDHIIPDDKSQTVAIAWGGLVNEGPMKYNYDGTYIESIENPAILLYGFYKWQDDEWFSLGSTTGNPQYPRDSMLMVFYNNNGEITKLFPRTVYPSPPTNNYTPYGRISLYKYNNQYKVFSPGNDTVYNVSKEELIPSEVIFSGRNAMPYNQYLDPAAIVGRHDLEIIAENDNIILIEKTIITKTDFREYRPGVWGGTYETDKQTIAIDKKNKKAAYIEITDDIFGFLPEGFLEYVLESIEDNRVSYSFDAIRYLTFLKEAGIDPQEMVKLAVSPDRLRGLTQDSNPIVISFVLRDHIAIK